MLSQRRWLEDIKVQENISYNYRRIVRTIGLVAIIMAVVVAVVTVAQNSKTSNRLTNDKALISESENLCVDLPDGWNCYESTQTDNIIIQKYTKDGCYINIVKYLNGSVNVDIEEYNIIKEEGDEKIYQKDGIYKIIEVKDDGYITIESNASLETIENIARNVK